MGRGTGKAAGGEKKKGKHRKGQMTELTKEGSLTEGISIIYEAQSQIHLAYFYIILLMRLSKSRSRLDGDSGRGS